MLNIIKNDTDKSYRIGYVLRADRTQYAFRYERVTAEDVQKIQYFQGLRTTTEEFIISTTKKFKFDILELSVILKGVRYRILDSYKEDSHASGGMFTSNYEVTTYMRVGK